MSPSFYVYWNRTGRDWTVFDFLNLNCLPCQDPKLAGSVEGPFESFEQLVSQTYYQYAVLKVGEQGVPRSLDELKTVLVHDFVFVTNAQPSVFKKIIDTVDKVWINTGFGAFSTYSGEDIRRLRDLP